MSSVWRIALTLALVGSVESLLSVEAIDQLDPEHRQTPKNRELIAQGVGNLCAGLVGGLPISAVIVRSSVNLTAGARTRWSGFIHGVLLLVSTLFISRWLNLIPLSVLAAILILTGYRLTRPRLYRQFLKRSSSQFFPFILTVLAILFTDLLVGIGIGLLFSIYFILNAHYKLPLKRSESQEDGSGRPLIEIKLTEIMSFLNKASLSKTLNEIPPGTRVVLDARGVLYFDDDVLEVIKKFRRTARQRGIRFELIKH
jgi:MFS superfamily sulfate permease-like transporter